MSHYVGSVCIVMACTLCMHNLWQAMTVYRINWNVLVCKVVLWNLIVMPNTENSLDYDRIQHCRTLDHINSNLELVLGSSCKKFATKH